MPPTHVTRGRDLRTIQEVLEHADLKTTSIHVHLAREVMKKELQEHALRLQSLWIINSRT